MFVSSVLSVMPVQSFCGKDEGFVVKTKDFWQRQTIILLFFIFTKNPSSLPKLHTNEWVATCTDATLGMCRHTNEGKSSD